MTDQIKGESTEQSSQVFDENDRVAKSYRENVYTVDYAIEKMGFGPFQILITVFCGLILLADAMELMLLSILSPAVKCQWNLTNTEEALITSIVFLGAFFGEIFWGAIFVMLNVANVFIRNYYDKLASFVNAFCTIGFFALLGCLEYSVLFQISPVF